jgi:hypothetical protein
LPYFSPISFTEQETSFFDFPRALLSGLLTAADWQLAAFCYFPIMTALLVHPCEIIIKAKKNIHNYSGPSWAVATLSAGDQRELARGVGL